MKISILIMNAYGMGGTIRATFNLADELSRRHEVEIVSVFQHKDRPFFPLSDRVRLSSLVDLRPDARKWWKFGVASRLKKPSTLLHPEERAYDNFSAESDRALTRYLADLRTDVLVTTRAGLNIAAARLARDGVTLIGQEHLHFGAHKPGILAEIRDSYQRLDAIVTLTDADHAEYARMLDGAPTRVYTIGNGLPAGPRPQSRLDNRVVIAAGRLVRVKGYDRLLDAFAKVVEKRPDWKLRVYGQGTQADKLSRRARRLGLHNNVAFMGPTNDIEGELAKASIHVITSRFEGFGMTIVEAFAAGVPVVSFDCPQGPREIITSGENGVLVPDGDIDAFADALLSLMDDPEKMRRLAENGRRTATRYDISEVAGRWDEMLAELHRTGTA
ncbi:glycosyltransferase family 4 protein [Actinoallomurus soli]|uniref:glycosyltransferase family 4 protein n=1 Tax=Actinoallomurus soli TaxID=2952535 RepID=UPI0020925151|nr:glycosyltransferase family 4 protein [Actinoallomurus soli]MCO5974420.1 glycosyltransferase family 4 protein [Actinoallomurus soli]